MISIICKDRTVNRDLRYIRGVGEKRALTLEVLGLRTAEDALLFLPRRYEDRTTVKNIAGCMPDDFCTIKAKLVSDVENKRFAKSKTYTKALFRDETGVLPVVWFNMPYIKNKLERHRFYALYGRVTAGASGMTMQNPIISEINQDQEFKPEIMPVYPLTKNIKQNEMRKIIMQCLELYSGRLEETIPRSLQEKRKLTDMNSAFYDIHRPSDLHALNQARNRLAYEELFFLQLSLLYIKSDVSSEEKNRKYKGNEEVKKFIESLPFKLTEPQTQVLAEIISDMDSERVMNRLVQGDVGSGKTIIAICASLKTCISGMQAAVMVPTSILAMQHYNTFREMLKDTGIRVDLLYSGIKGAEKKEILQSVNEGRTGILIGTHSLLQETVQFRNLGLVVTDEQHRFGVRQRFNLVSKGEAPDKLILTATPIPRTLALIIYGDMDISLMKGLPPGRKAVETYAVDSAKRKRIFAFLEKNIREGRQAYIICPLVEDSEAIEAESVMEYTEKIRQLLPEASISPLTGRMKSEEKESILLEFSMGNTDILVSTTVIEIGINVPNANIIVIENAERYGLAQLHQLRGRVGRGTHQSYCIMISDSENALTKQRIETLASSNDGFHISEMDLKLRGPGDFFGTLQHGLPRMQIANLYEDIDMLKQVQEDIMEMNEKELIVSDEEFDIIEDIVKQIREQMINA